MTARRRTAIVARNAVFGRAAILKFRAVNAHILVVAQSESAADRALGLGADEALVADPHDVDGLATTLAGIDTLVYDPGLNRHAQADDPAVLVAAAARAAVSHVILISCLKPLTLDNRGFELRLAYETALARSDLRYSVLQPAMFMQNIGFLLADLQRTRTFAWPWDVTQRFAMVDAMDVAEVAAHVATDPALAGGTYELCAEEITAEAIAERLSAILGYGVSARRSDTAGGPSAYHADIAPGWCPDALGVEPSRIDSHGYPGGNNFVLGRLLGRTPMFVDAFLRRIAQSFLTVHQDKPLTGEALMDAMFLSLMSSEL